MTSDDGDSPGSGDGEDDDDEEGGEDDDDEDGGSDSEYDDENEQTLNSPEGDGERSLDSGDEASMVTSDPGSPGSLMPPKQEFSVEQLFMNSNGILVDEAQLEKEKSYVAPTEPEMKSKSKLIRLDCRHKLE